MGRFKNSIAALKVFLCLTMVIFMIFPEIALADQNPLVNAGNKISSTLFGVLGGSLCTIILGATFIMAKLGKITWDRFLVIFICIAGFFGSPAIMSIIRACA